MEKLNIDLFYFVNKLASVSDFQDKVIIFFAEHLAYILIVAFIVWLFKKQDDNKRKIEIFAEAISAIIIGRGLIVETIRFFYHHERPFVALPSVNQLLTENSYSFPSGHATLFFALSTVVYKYNQKLGITFFILSGLMGIARVASGVHFPFDIIAGGILGVSVGYLSFILVEKTFTRLSKTQ